jgi:chemosensory pili system protein ChpA (sensor histidine kinase/response regulator)
MEHVLVVEDDDDIREVLEQLLATEGFRVEVAKDGLDAVEKLRAIPGTSVILLDMMMPNMDGESFLAVLRGTPALADIPVVVISGDASARDRANELRAAACLVKPFEIEELLGVVHRFA